MDYFCIRLCIENLPDYVGVQAKYYFKVNSFHKNLINYGLGHQLICNITGKFLLTTVVTYFILKYRKS